MAFGSISDTDFVDLAAKASRSSSWRMSVARSANSLAITQGGFSLTRRTTTDAAG
jgi:hypothetical protein